MTTATTPLPPTPMTAGVSARLSGMMFLQYAVWGVWLPYLASYLNRATTDGGLGFTQNQVGWILGLAASIGAVSAPFIAGQVADRYLNAERALGLLLFVGGILNLVLARVEGYGVFLFVSVLYSIAFMPTLSLTNSIAFQNLDDPERKFPSVRLWGTIGWVVASIGFTSLWLTAPDKFTNTRRIADALSVSGVVSILYAFYAFCVLPKTPPKRSGEALAFLKAFRLLGNPTFLLITLIALPIAMIHQVYFFRVAPFFGDAIGVPDKWFGPVFGIGQFSEAAFLLVLGVLLKRVGYKAVLILGCLGYAARFGIFAIGQPPALVIASQLLHGLCYGCFFAGSFLLVEKIAPEDIRHSAQTVYGIIILGLGPILAGFYNGQILGRFGEPPNVDYRGVWLTQSGIALAAALILLLAFRYRPTPHAHTPTAADHHDGHLV
ncbi:MAG: MFS transporter [Tepidisphaeraceae bacterium]